MVYSLRREKHSKPIIPYEPDQSSTYSTFCHEETFETYENITDEMSYTLLDESTDIEEDDAMSIGTASLLSHDEYETDKDIITLEYNTLEYNEIEDIRLIQKKSDKPLFIKPYETNLFEEEYLPE